MTDRTRDVPAAQTAGRPDNQPDNRPDNLMDNRTGLGIFLVAAAALVWSFGGALARTLDVSDTWSVIFWRSLFASLFLLTFMLVRDGPRGTLGLLKAMGWPGIAVGLCFATASGSFVIALQYTTVAYILLVQAATPLIAALIGVILLGERVRLATWGCIAAVFAGVAVMVSASLTAADSLIGNALSLTIPVVLAIATVVTRRYANVRMTPAVFTGTLLMVAVAAPLVSIWIVSPMDYGLLFAFGALNLGLGLALFTTGARLVAAPVAAMIGTLETVLAPIWVWLTHGEVASSRTLIGGGIVLAALVVHIITDALYERRAAAATAAGRHS